MRMRAAGDHVAVAERQRGAGAIGKDIRVRGNGRRYDRAGDAALDYKRRLAAARPQRAADDCRVRQVTGERGLAACHNLAALHYVSAPSPALLRAFALASRPHPYDGERCKSAACLTSA